MRTRSGALAAKSDANAALRLGEGKSVSASAATEPVAPTSNVSRMAAAARGFGAKVIVESSSRNHHHVSVNAASNSMVLVKWTHCMMERASEMLFST